MSYIESSLKIFLQQPYQDSKAFLSNVIFPVFGEENFESAGNLNVLPKRPDLQAKADATGILEIHNIGILYVEGSELDIFDITIDYKKQLQRNRVEIQQIIRSILSSHSGAFILFHYQSGARWEWRFTFCHKGASNDDSTDAKRYTFLLGPGQSCRTAAANFTKIHEKIEKEGSFEMQDIIQAFDVEALSKEFFGKYKAHYEKFCNYVYENKSNPTSFGHEFSIWSDKTIRDYVKKLLGRIVFLHFLQKKGWLGVPADQSWGEGDRQFMKTLYLQASPSQQANYLDEVLEPLFQKALDTDRKSSDDLFDTGVEGFRSVKIPYLNGGLFERDILDEPHSIFPADYFKDLFEFLSEYNFTIDENDPNDAEVGVDPEMLGRIFENLLEDNKDKGAFYTPKEIVQYMCRESLIAYLTTSSIEGGNQNPRDKVEAAIRQLLQKPDEIVPRMSDIQKENFGEALRKVRICDPAIGSGAFPMGLLNELVRCRVSIDAWAKAENGQKLTDDYAALKREIICNNIYGVDIERGAVDIARLRFWLSIVVDEQEPQILPNLDYKFMEGNSMITTFDGNYIDLTSQSLDKNHAEKIRNEKRSLYQLKKKYYTASGDEKMRLAVDIKDSILRIVAVQLGFESRNWLRSNVQQFELGFAGDAESMSFNDIKKCLPKEKLLAIELAESLHRQLKDETIPLKKRAQLDIHFFDWRIMFTEVFDCAKSGFDIVIGNPPYIKEYTNREAFDGFRDASPYYIGKMDLWYGFACHGIDMLSSNGVIAFIAQNNWTTSAGASIMRNKVIKDSRIIQLLDFNDYMVFGEASIQTMIMLFRKNNVEDSYLFDHRKLCAGGTKQDLLSMLRNGISGNYVQLFPIISREAYYNTYLTFSVNDNLLRKLVYNKSWLQTKELAQGIVFPQDFLNKKGALALGHHNAGDGIFGLTKDEKDGMCLSFEEEELIKPYYTTEEIGRYYTNPNNHLWMIYTDSSFKNANRMDLYPTLKNHIDQFLPILTSDNKPYGLHRARNNYFFNGEKIIALRKCVGRPSFSYNDFECYVTQTFYSIKTDRWNMKFLTGVLNSKLIAFWLKHRGKMQGENYQLDKDPLLNIPLPIETCEQSPIIAHVDRILAAKKANPQADVSAEEKEIDRLVYDLYGLTEAEIAIIEGSVK